MSGKILRDETYVRNLEGFSVQIRKTAGIRGKAEGELVGVERLNFAVVLLVELAVFAVAEQGIASCRHLGADLVGFAGDQFYGQQGIFPSHRTGSVDLFYKRII